MKSQNKSGFHPELDHFPMVKHTNIGEPLMDSIETCTELQATRLLGGHPRFGNSAMDPPVPVAVKAQRKQLGWSTKERRFTISRRSELHPSK